jgi:hypothetical protein
MNKYYGYESGKSTFHISKIGEEMKANRRLKVTITDDELMEISRD